MTKPIAFIDHDFLSTLNLNYLNEPVTDAIDRLTQAYDIRLTPQVLNEIKLGPTYKNLVIKAWVDSLPIETAPTTTFLYQGGLVGNYLYSGEAIGLKNLGDLSILEAAGRITDPVVILSDDLKFFGEISKGKLPVSFVINRNETYLRIASDFASIFPQEKAIGFTPSIALLKERYDAGLITKEVYVDSARIAMKLPSPVDLLSLAERIGRYLNKTIDPSDLVIGIAALVVASTLPGDAFAQELESQASGLGMGVAVTLFAMGVALAFPGSAMFITAVLFAAGVVGMVYELDHLMDLFNEAFPGLLANISSPLLQLLGDPLVLDLDSDGVELTALAGSSVHFDYDGDGLAERTGWVSPDDGILVLDRNGNGAVDGGAELFGSATQDGFAVLETFDSNGDGKIDALDAAFGQMRIWRDLDQDGVVDAGEMQTLTEAGIASISLARNDLPGTNAGHGVGYEAVFTRADGTTGNAQTIYFQTDRQDTRIDKTPNFTPAAGVDKLPGLGGSGTIFSIAHKLTNDVDFRAAWTALTDNAGTLSPDQLHGQFEALLLRWAGVDGVAIDSRGPYVDARHLAFVEAFFGEGYREVRSDLGQEVRTYPGRPYFALGIEASYQNVITVLETAFLAQTAFSTIARGGELAAAFANPYFFYTLLDFGSAQGSNAPETPGNIGLVTELILESIPEGIGAAAGYLSKALAGLEGMVTIAFDGNRTAYSAAIAANLAAIDDPLLRQIASSIVNGSAKMGTVGPEGIGGGAGDDVFLAGAGDLIIGRSGSDIAVYSKVDGDLWILDESTSVLDKDQLVLADLNVADVSLMRVRDHLVITVTATGKRITIENLFQNFETSGRGIEAIWFADGTEWNRAKLQAEAVFEATSPDGVIVGSSLDDIIMASRGDNEIYYNEGNDTIIYRQGDGNDILIDGVASGAAPSNDLLILSDLNSDQVVVSRVGDSLVITIKETGEFIRDVEFFSGTKGLDRVKFANGETWDRARIEQEAWIRGGDTRDSMAGSSRDDTLIGGKAADVLAGGVGDDTYIWSKGDGSDTIEDFTTESGETDKLWLKDVRSNDVRLSYHGDTLLITILPTGEVIEVNNQFWESTNLQTEWGDASRGIELIQFANGEVWDREEIAHKTGSQYLGRDYEWFSWTVVVDGRPTLVYNYFIDEFGNQGDAHLGANYGLHDIILGNRGVSPYVDHPDLLLGGAGHNVLDGQYGDDTLTGGDGDDILYGDNGNDILNGDNGAMGADGNDILSGGYGADQLFGGAGTDRLDGGAGNDILNGGDGKDYLNGADGDDVLRGGEGDDTISGSDGHDTYMYSSGDGNDWISDSDGQGSETDTLVLTDLNVSDVTFRRSGDNVVIRVNSTGHEIVLFDQFPVGQEKVGIEKIRFADGTEWDKARSRQEAWYRGSDGRDVISTSGRDDIIEAGKGDDIISSYDGSDTFVYSKGDGNDVIREKDYLGSDIDTLLFKDLNAADVTFHRTSSDLVIRINDTGHEIVIEGQLSATSGPYGLERVRFADGTDWDRTRMQQEAWYRGSDGRDRITTSGKDDTVLAGKGSDWIDSSDGSDTFIYSKGDGNDVIDERDFQGSEIDTLVFADLNVSDVTFRRLGDDLVIQIRDTGEEVLLIKQCSPYFPYGVEVIRFADGTEWDRDTILAAGISGSSFIAGGNGDDVLIGAEASQNIYGNRGNDRIDGLAGSDLQYGSGGNDTLVVSQSNAGDVDRLNGGADNDTAEFADFASAVWVDLVTNGREARTRDSGDLLSGQWRDIAEIEQVENVIGTAFDDSLAGDANANILHGGAGNDLLDGRSGNDMLIGGDGNDTLDGYIGDDTLDAGAGDDVLIGGLGSDVLMGGTGSDTYRYLATGGRDIILDEDDPTSGVDVLQLSDLNASDVTLWRAGEDLWIRNTATGEVVTVKQQFIAQANSGLESIVFANGATLNRGDIFDRASVVIPLAAGSDNGFTTNEDTAITIGTAALLSNDSGTGPVELVSVGNAAGGQVSRAPSGDILFTPAANFNGIASFSYTITDFWGGTVTGTVEIEVDPVNDAPVLSQALADQQSMTEQSVSFTVPANAFIDSDGDTLAFVATLDDGSPLPAWLVFDPVTRGFSGTPPADLRGVLKITVTASDGMLSASDTFALRIIGDEFDVTHLGTAGADSITGSSGADVISGMAGDDSLAGGAGNDTYLYARGDGHDTVNEGNAGTDRLMLADINPSSISLLRSGNDLTLVISESSIGAGDGGSIKLLTQLSPGKGVENIFFADGTVWTPNDLRLMLLAQASTSGDDIITAFDGNDTLAGGQGNDTLNGGSGRDTYVYTRGDGHDTINEVLSVSDPDRLILQGINPADISLVRDGNNVTLMIAESAQGAGDGGSILLNDQLDSSFDSGVEEIVFADGTMWTQENLRVMVLAQAATSGDDTISGFANNDTIAGGLGNDTLNGGSGNDTYVYAPGDGRDVIVESAGTDKIQLNDIVPADVTVVKNGNNIILLIGQAGGRITIRDQLVTSTRIESILFANGTVWTYQQLEALAVANDGSVVTHYGTSAADTLTGTSDLDVFQAGLGNDTLSGVAGSDVYIYASGDGSDTINDNSGSTANVDTLKLIDLNPADVTLTREGQLLKITVIATGETITVQSQFYSTTANWGIERILFADGTSLDLAAIKADAWIRGTGGNDTLTGTAEVDTIAGYDGNDTLNGAAGADTLIGGLGDDAYTVDNAGDVIVESAGEGTDTVQSFVTYALSAHVENLTLAGSLGIHATGNSGANVLTGNSGNNILAGLGGADVLNGGLGTDTVTYAASAAGINVSLVANTGSSGDAAGDTFLSIENIIGSDFDDVIEGTSGANNLNGGAGIDTVSYQNAASAVTVNLSTTTAQNTGSGSDTLSGFENLTGSSYNDTLTGTTGANLLTGLAGNDSLTGLAGSDTFVFLAGFGKDTIQDFTAGAGSDDIIAFGNDVFADFASVLAAASQVGSDTLITVNANNTLTLKNVTMANLHADDFSFLAA